MRILLTGGAGFIGSHFARHLLAKGHTVGLLDCRPDWKLAPQHPNCQWGVLDCRDLPGWVDVTKWDFVYHLASTVGVSRVLADPKECIDNIVESTRAVLRLGIPGMYFSTSEVYGKNQNVLREDSDCILTGKSRWSYAAAKLCGEWLSLAQGWKVVRLFNVIGPNQSLAYGAVVPRFIDCARRGVEMPIYGDGRQTRTFTSVFDVVEILDRLRSVPFGVVNVGSRNTVAIYELALAVRRLSGLPMEGQLGKLISYHDAYGPDFEECPARIPDVTKLQSLIGNFQFRSLEATLRETLGPWAEMEISDRRVAEVTGRNTLTALQQRCPDGGVLGRAADNSQADVL